MAERAEAGGARGGSHGPARLVRVSIEGEPAHLNPLLESEASTGQIVFGTVYEPLVSCTPEGEYQPALADGWQTSADGLRLSLHLRPAARWHDGHLLSVLDVQASLEPFLGSARGVAEVLRATLSDVASLELLPDRVVRLTLKRPSGYVLRALCDIAILPEHLLRGENADPALLAKQPIGTGPLRFLAWERGKRIRLAPFPGYWGRAAGVDGGFDELSFKFDADGARALARARRGDVDVLLRVLPVYFPDEVDAVTLHGKLQLARLTPPRFAYVAVNHRRLPLGDPAFRRALAALWDRDRFARDLHHGLAHPLSTLPLPADPAAGDGDEGASQSRTSAVATSPAQAAAAFEGAGYRDGDADGVRDLNGAPIRLSLLLAAGSRGAATEAHAFVLEARKAGILVDSQALDATSLMVRVKKADFDLALLEWEGRADEDPSLLFGAGAQYNHSGFRSPEVESLLDALRAANGPQARRPLLGRLAARLESEQPVLFLYRFDRLLLVADRLVGLAGWGDRVDFSHAWIAP